MAISFALRASERRRRRHKHRVQLNSSGSSCNSQLPAPRPPPPSPPPTTPHKMQFRGLQCNHRRQMWLTLSVLLALVAPLVQAKHVQQQQQQQHHRVHHRSSGDETTSCDGFFDKLNVTATVAHGKHHIAGESFVDLPLEIIWVKLNALAQTSCGLCTSLVVLYLSFISAPWARIGYRLCVALRCTWDERALTHAKMILKFTN